MSEPVYTPVLPRGPLRLSAARMRAHYEAGGRPALWDEVRRALVDRLGSRARSRRDVEALRAWVDLEHEPTFRYFVDRFEAGR